MIETERLILRSFTENDAADVYEYLKETAVNCFADMKLHSIREAKSEMRRRAKEHDLYFAVVLKENGKVIGEVFGEPEGHDPDDDAADTFSPCWMLNRKYWGKGYAFEAVSAYLDYLFNKKGIRRIYAYTEDFNPPSRHLCEKLGMRFEGLFVEFICFEKNPDGTPHYEKTVQYAVLKKEWNSRAGGEVNG